MRIILLAIFTIFASSSLFAINYTANAGLGLWSTSTNWTPVGVPVAGDNVTIPDGSTMRILNTTEACSSVFLDCNNGGSSTNANLIIIGTGSLTVSGNVTMDEDFALIGSSLLNITTTTSLTIGGNLIMNVFSTTGARIFMSSGASTLNLAGTFTFPFGTAGTLNGGTLGSTFNYNGAVAQTVIASASTVAYCNVTTNNSHASGATFDAALSATNLTGNLDNASGILNSGGFTHVIGGTFSNAGTFAGGTGALDLASTFTNTGTFTSGGCSINLEGNWSNTGTYTPNSADIVEFDGATAQTISGTTGFANITMTNTSGGVSFPSGTSTVAGTFDINNCVVTNTAATVSLLSTGSGTGQLMDMGTGSYVGSLNVQRQVACTNQGFRELTSPVSGTVLDDWEDDGIVMAGFTNSDNPGFPFVSVYTYNEAAAAGVKNNGWANAVDATTDATGPSAAHRVYMDATTFNMSVTGTPIQGPQSLAVTRTGADDNNDGWNFIGNPYACTVDWDNLAAGDKTGIDEIYYVWNSTAGAYASHETASTDLNGGSQFLAHSQGMWVHCSATSTLDWNEDDKVTTDQAFIKSSDKTVSNDMIVKISSTMNSYYNEIALRTRKLATTNMDQGLDFLKLSSLIPDDVAEIAFVSDDGAELAVNSIPEESSTVMLKAFAGVNALGTYTLDFTDVSQFAKNACVRLEDLTTGIITDLRSTPTYTYTVLAGDEASARFLIHVDVQYDVNEEAVSCFNMTDGMLDISHNESSSFNVTWADTSGTVLGTATSSSANYTIAGLQAGDYMINVSGACATEDFPVSIGNTAEVVANFSADVTIDVDVDLTIINGSTGATNYIWDMGDGTLYTDVEPLHSYANPGTYTITLNADNDNIGSCTDTKTFVVEVLNAAGMDDLESINVSAYVSNDQLIISNENGLSLSNIQLLDIEGKLILNRMLNVSANTSIDLPNLATGAYVIKINTNEGMRAIKIVI